MNKERNMQAWCDSFKTSKLWLTAIQADKSGSVHTLKSYCNGLKVFCDWIGKTPDQLIAERKLELKNEETTMNAENKLREFCVWLENSGKSKTTVVCKYHAVVKSLYKYNGVPLILPTPKHASRERKPHTLEEIKSLLQFTDVRERFFIMMLKDSGCSREDIVTLKYGDIQSEYETNKEVIHIRIIRKKESIEYSTFIGKNAIDNLRIYLDYRQRKGEKITKNTPLFATLDGQPMTGENLSQMFVRLGLKAGFLTSPHRFRKFFESHMGLAAPSIVVKSWMGHTLGVEKSYFLPPLEEQRKLYAEGYKQIDLFKTSVNDLEMRKQLLIDQLVMLKPNIDRKALDNVLACIKTPSELDSFRDNISKRGLENITAYVRRKEDKDSANNDCQKVIEEQELTGYIEKGWKFVSVLPSGKIVVTNE